MIALRIADEGAAWPWRCPQVAGPLPLDAAPA